MAGPNQTGSTLNSPVSSSMGYGQSLVDQQAAEAAEKRKKAMQLANSAAPQSPMGTVSGMMGMV